MKKIAGEALIRQNRVAWEELKSLRQMLADFQQQNDELAVGIRNSEQVCGSQHRELLRRQAKLLLESVQARVEACGRTLEDILPDQEDRTLCQHLLGAPEHPPKTPSGCLPSPPATPSTRPSTSSGRSSCTPEPPGLPPASLGRALGYEEITEVGAGIREALEAEHAALMVAISEQTDLLEAEASRRATEVGRMRRAPSTAALQQFAHKLQEVLVSPGLHTLECTADVEKRTAANHTGEACSPSHVADALGGASARRLKALIVQRRRDHQSQPALLCTVPEFGANSDKNPSSPTAGGLLVCGGPLAGEGKMHSILFDDPFSG